MNEETPDGYVTRLIGGGFAGMGGPALVCRRCGCLLPLEDAATQTHDKFHDALRAIAAAIDEHEETTE